MTDLSAQVRAKALKALQGTMQPEEDKSMKEADICYNIEYKDYPAYNFDVVKGARFKEFLIEIYNGLYRENLDLLQVDPLRLAIDPEYVNPKHFFRNIMTDYVVNEMFMNNMEFIAIDIINRVMQHLMDAYFEQTGIRVDFIYRGGNILRIYSDLFKQYLPYKSAKFIGEVFGRYFKNSDFDFLMIINQEKSGYKNESMSPKHITAINMQVQALVYYALFVSRCIIYANEEVFGLCKYSQEYVDNLFQSKLDEMNRDKGETGIPLVENLEYIGLGYYKHFYVNPRYNYLIKNDIFHIPSGLQKFVFDDGNRGNYEALQQKRKSGHNDLVIKTNYNENYIDIFKASRLDKEEMFFNQERFAQLSREIMHGNNNYLDIYITNNLAIRDPISDINFKLSRSMFNFSLLYKATGDEFGMTNISSELYDVSQMESNDRAFKLYNSNSYIKYPYKFSSLDDPETIIENYIYIPKLEVTIIDLIIILFNPASASVALPWTDVKYVKRLYRLFLLVFMLEFENKDVYQVEQELDKFTPSRIFTDRAEEDETINFEYIRKRIKIIRDQMATKGKSMFDFNNFMMKVYEIIAQLMEIVKYIKQYVIRKGEVDYEF